MSFLIINMGYITRHAILWNCKRHLWYSAVVSFISVRDWEEEDQLKVRCCESAFVTNERPVFARENAGVSPFVTDVCITE